MMRIGLFLATNIAVLFVFTIVSSIFGLDRIWYSNTGTSYISLLVICALFGFGGSFVSLLMSKTMAKRGMRVDIIENPTNQTESWLLQTVQRQAQAAGIAMPEVGIFPDQSANAFATGANRNNALVAVSAGLLNKMQREEVEAVLGHEIAHVANGDMVTMTLLQGVLNTFVLFFSKIVGMIVDKAVFKNDNGPGMGYFLTSMLAQIVFGVLASMIISWFSRYREFRADEGGARFSSRQNMINALQRLQQEQQPPILTEQLNSFGIRPGHKLASLFSTHPPLATRIKALKN